MKAKFVCLLGAVGLLAVAFCLPASAQTYSINWYKIANGGGTSTNGSFSLSGTIGQKDASGAMGGGNYSVTGGFWSLINVVQTAGAPKLNITLSGTNVIVSWTNSGSFTLQQNANVAMTNGWSATSFNIATNNGMSSISISSPSGNLFFRLKTP